MAKCLDLRYAQIIILTWDSDACLFLALNRHLLGWEFCAHVQHVALNIGSRELG